jgi:hypothetical protein
MIQNLGFSQIILDYFTGTIPHAVIAFGISAAIALLSICLLSFTYRLAREKKKTRVLPAPQESLPALTDARKDTEAQTQNGDLSPVSPVFQAFTKDLIASAVAKGVPVGPLQSVLGNLIAAGIYDEDIPGRLLAAADQPTSTG